MSRWRKPPEPDHKESKPRQGRQKLPTPCRGGARRSRSGQFKVGFGAGLGKMASWRIPWDRPGATNTKILKRTRKLTPKLIRREKALAVGIVAKDGFAPVAAVQDVVDGAGEFDAGMRGLCTVRPQRKE